MKKPRVVFTDSGLGGLPIMADFVKLVKDESFSVDSVFFNAQYSRDLGYKKMDSKMQVKIFNRVLEAIDKRYNPDIIAIACNTLSVVYYQTDFYKKNKTTQVFDIIEIGKSLIEQSKSNTIIQVAMPTTIDSEIYNNKSKKNIGISSDVMLPDAIENDYQEKTEQMLANIFKIAKKELEASSLGNKKTSLFLGCTHFPIIKDAFLNSAKKNEIKIHSLLNPNKAFAQLIFDELTKLNRISNDSKSDIQVVSRTLLQDTEVRNISQLIENQSFNSATALRNYKLDQALF